MQQGRKIYWLLKGDWKNDWIFFLTPFMSSFYVFFMLWMTETTILWRASSLLWFGMPVYIKCTVSIGGNLNACALCSLVATMSRQTSYLYRLLGRAKIFWNSWAYDFPKIWAKPNWGSDFRPFGENFTWRNMLWSWASRRAMAYYSEWQKLPSYDAPLAFFDLVCLYT